MGGGNRAPESAINFNSEVQLEGYNRRKPKQGQWAPLLSA
ncbi:hypothetical protein BC792_103218 [Sphingobacterium allocomposti]|uniref:Uncharacterized protein n=1 Tax=Sphingobacterium allocomposti TaxID=415956 RepID=A0A5S5DN44_9SPHI|nr:hypothetical protein BC792_103218 [Sphingobacterium composti Yoo et al. 2007 non Ten et al. 2007]